MLLQLKKTKKRPFRSSLNRQQGVVIVVALFIVALVAAMTYLMLARLERDTWRTRLILHTTEAQFYAEGSIAWAKDYLRNNWEQQKNNKIIDFVPTQSSIAKVNGYQIQSTIYDLQARFNINNLVTMEGQVSFSRLLKAVAPQLTDSECLELIRVIADWLTESKQDNEYTKYYLDLPTAYYPAHRLMLDVNELRLIKNVTPKIFAQLRPFISALPMTATKVNVQTAPAPVLLTVSSSLTLEGAKAIERYREQNPIVSLENFQNTEFGRRYTINPRAVAVVSHYFLVETTAVIEAQHLVLYTLLERIIKGIHPEITILWQSKGTW